MSIKEWDFRESGSACKLHGLVEVRGQRLRVRMVNQYIYGLDEDPECARWSDFTLILKETGGEPSWRRVKEANNLVRDEMIRRFKG